MSKRQRKNLSPSGRELCDALGPDDGVDPRWDWKETRATPRLHHQQARLCQQVLRALDAAHSALGDPALAGLEVVAVDPDPDGSRLRVTLLLNLPNTTPTSQVQAQLRGAQRTLSNAEGALRASVGEAITRRRVPRLRFEVRLRELGAAAEKPLNSEDGA